MATIPGRPALRRHYPLLFLAAALAPARAGAYWGQGYVEQAKDAWRGYRASKSEPFENAQGWGSWLSVSVDGKTLNCHVSRCGKKALEKNAGKPVALYSFGKMASKGGGLQEATAVRSKYSLVVENGNTFVVSGSRREAVAPLSGSASSPDSRVLIHAPKGEEPRAEAAPVRAAETSAVPVPEDSAQEGWKDVPPQEVRPSKEPPSKAPAREKPAAADSSSPWEKAQGWSEWRTGFVDGKAVQCHASQCGPEALAKNPGAPIALYSFANQKAAGEGVQEANAVRSKYSLVAEGGKFFAVSGKARKEISYFGIDSVSSPGSRVLVHAPKGEAAAAARQPDPAAEAKSPEEAQAAKPASADPPASAWEKAKGWGEWPSGIVDGKTLQCHASQCSAEALKKNPGVPVALFAFENQKDGKEGVREAAAVRSKYSLVYEDGRYFAVSGKEKKEFLTFGPSLSSPDSRVLVHAPKGVAAAEPPAPEKKPSWSLANFFGEKEAPKPRKPAEAASPWEKKEGWSAWYGGSVGGKTVYCHQSECGPEAFQKKPDARVRLYAFGKMSDKGGGAKETAASSTKFELVQDKGRFFAVTGTGKSEKRREIVNFGNASVAGPDATILVHAPKAGVPSVGDSAPVQEKAAVQMAPEKGEASAAAAKPRSKPKREAAEPKALESDKEPGTLRGWLSSVYQNPERAVIEHLVMKQEGGMGAFWKDYRASIKKNALEDFKKSWSQKAREAISSQVKAPDKDLAQALSNSAVTRDDLMSYHCEGLLAAASARPAGPGEDYGREAMKKLIAVHAAGDNPDAVNTAFDGSKVPPECAQFMGSRSAEARAEEMAKPRAEAPKLGVKPVPEPAGEEGKKLALTADGGKPGEGEKPGGFSKFVSDWIPSGCSRPK